MLRIAVLRCICLLTGYATLVCVAVCRPHLCEQDPSALERVSGLAALHRDMEALLAAADEGDEDGEGQGQGLGQGEGDDEDWSEL